MLAWTLAHTHSHTQHTHAFGWFFAAYNTPINTHKHSCLLQQHTVLPQRPTHPQVEHYASYSRQSLDRKSTATTTSLTRSSSKHIARHSQNGSNSISQPNSPHLKPLGPFRLEIPISSSHPELSSLNSTPDVSTHSGYAQFQLRQKQQRELEPQLSFQGQRTSLSRHSSTLSSQPMRWAAQLDC